MAYASTTQIVVYFIPDGNMSDSNPGILQFLGAQPGEAAALTPGTTYDLNTCQELQILASTVTNGTDHDLEQCRNSSIWVKGVCDGPITTKSTECPSDD